MAAEVSNPEQRTTSRRSLIWDVLTALYFLWTVAQWVIKSVGGFSHRVLIPMSILAVVFLITSILGRLPSWRWERHRPALVIGVVFSVLVVGLLGRALWFELPSHTLSLYLGTENKEYIDGINGVLLERGFWFSTPLHTVEGTNRWYTGEGIWSGHFKLRISYSKGSPSFFATHDISIPRRPHIAVDTVDVHRPLASLFLRATPPCFCRIESHTYKGYLPYSPEGPTDSIEIPIQLQIKIEEGPVNLTFSARGYSSFTINNYTVKAGELNAVPKVELCEERVSLDISVDDSTDRHPVAYAHVKSALNDTLLITDAAGRANLLSTRDPDILTCTHPDYLTRVFPVTVTGDTSIRILLKKPVHRVVVHTKSDDGLVLGGVSVVSDQVKVATDQDGMCTPELTAGRHLMKFTKRGYRTVSHSIQVPRSRALQVTLPYEPLVVRVVDRVTSKVVDDAVVTLSKDGSATQKTTVGGVCSFHVTMAGPFSITVEKTHYEPITARVIIPRVTPLEVRLHREDSYEDELGQARDILLGPVGKTLKEEGEEPREAFEKERTVKGYYSYASDTSRTFPLDVGTSPRNELVPLGGLRRHVFALNDRGDTVYTRIEFIRKKGTLKLAATLETIRDSAKRGEVLEVYKGLCEYVEKCPTDTQMVQHLVDVAIELREFIGVLRKLEDRLASDDLGVKSHAQKMLSKVIMTMSSTEKQKARQSYQDRIAEPGQRDQRQMRVLSEISGRLK